MVGVNTKSQTTRRTLKVWRQIAGLTQVQLAKQIGTDSGTISKYENGAVVPSALRLREIARILSVSADDIELTSRVSA
jgi:transcriptional regulator with XRE-family HTH domain